MERRKRRDISGTEWWMEWVKVRESSGKVMGKQLWLYLSKWGTSKEEGKERQGREAVAGLRG